MEGIQDLEKYIKAKGMKKSFLYEKLGISHTAWQRRITGKTPFRVKEVKILCELLDIPTEEMTKIFFG